MTDALRFTLVTTHQVGSRSADMLYRLIESVKGHGSLDIQLHCLLQSAADVPSELRRLQSPSIRYYCVPDRLSLSRARNFILRRIVYENTDYILFPDDDCWFQAGYFDYLSTLSATENPDLIFVRNDDPPTGLLSAPPARKAETMDVLRRINSNNIIISSRLAARVGEFDERLGLGTPLGGGEDTDFALRAFRLASKPVFVEASLVGHRSLNGDAATRIREMQRYWPGVMLHTLENISASLLPLTAYRIAGGMFLVATGRLSISRFLLPFRTWLLPASPAPGRPRSDDVTPR